MKWFAQFRLFFICAVLVSAAIELAHSELFSLPAEQLTVSALGGAAGLVIAKIVHVV